MQELTYPEVATVFGVCVRQVKNLIKQNPTIIQPIIYSYKNRRFDADQVARLQRKLRADAVKRGKSLAKKAGAK